MEDKSDTGRISYRKKSKYRFDYGKLIARILCIIIAFGIWVYVKENDDTKYTEKFENIKVVLNGESELFDNYGLSVFGDDSYYCDVTLIGQKSFVSKVSSKDIKAYVDLSGINSLGTYELDVNFEIPNDVMIDETSVSSLVVFVDKKAVKSVQLDAKLNQYSYPPSYEIGTLEPAETTITVTGPSCIIDNVDHALSNLNVGYISSSFMTTGDISLIDTTGNKITSEYVKLSRTSVNVYIPVYTTREFDVSYSLKYGCYNNTNSVITIYPSKINLKGDPAVLDEVGQYLNFEIDETSIVESTVITKDIVLPDSVFVMDDVNKINITVSLKDFKTKSIEIPKDRITIFGGVIDYSVIDQNISVIVCGKSNLVDSVTIDDMYILLDLEQYSRYKGSIVVPCTVMFDSEYSDLSVLGAVNVIVLIN